MSDKPAKKAAEKPAKKSEKKDIAGADNGRSENTPDESTALEATPDAMFGPSTADLNPAFH